MIPSDLDDLVTHHFTDLGGLKMHWVEAGAGPTVVLLHGFPEMWWSWRHQIEALAEAGFRVVVPDQRGYNDTDKQGPYDLDTLANDICLLIESLGGERKARIVGHDWGGAVAWHLAATRPGYCERLATLNCPHPDQLRRAALKPRQLRRSWYMFFFMVPALADRLLTRNDAGGVIKVLRGNARDRTNFSNEELEPFRLAIQKPGAVQGMLGWYRAIPRALMSWKPLPVIDVETLVVWGMADDALGYDDLVPGTERLAPKLRVVKIEGAGHFVQSDAPKAVNEALIGFFSQ